LLVTMLSGCGAAGRLANVGKAPKMTPMDDLSAPVVEPSLGNQAAQGRRGSPATTDSAPQTASLFREGAGAFLRDQRAARVGDILTIRINIADRATVGNTTTRSRAGNESAGIASLLGLENTISKILPGNPDTDELVDTESSSTSRGAGNTTRSEQINMTMAA